ncbi:site-2 protease family protein [candidate division WOR-3 bacterium]|uniref:Site-2 protease family protein n=1 Tax=candidate division WOR-3 bacterium TaxID=2052148 RepID=A0A9D5K9A8_UNCW3|nr:site-2 protease family protein [candidate division WOR-3 bacterium]MBD3364741.1 site-2 protease family protein [candidate division WOR-3 bacterium]
MNAAELIPKLRGYMSVADVKMGVRFIILKGMINNPQSQNIQTIRTLVKEAGLTPFFEHSHDSADTAHTLKIGLFRMRKVKQRFWLNWLLLGITVITTTLAGSVWFGADILSNPLLVYKGLPFAGALLLILGSHELGHYFACRHYGMQATPPFFIPFLPFFIVKYAGQLTLIPFFGTMGAVIRMGITPNRRALIRVGVAGPIVGFIVAIPVTIAGLALSEYVPGIDGGLSFSEPLVFKGLMWVVDLFRQVKPAEGMILTIHPVALAGWIGFLITSLNLLPLSQLDGGHISYGVFGKKRIWLTIGTYALMVAAIIYTFMEYQQPSVWLVWGGLTLLLGFKHPPSEDEITPLSRGDIFLAAVALGILILTVMPVPIR